MGYRLDGPEIATKHGSDIISDGAVYSSLGIAAVFMPALLGIVADKWLSAKWVYAIWR